MLPSSQMGALDFSPPTQDPKQVASLLSLPGNACFSFRSSQSKSTHPPRSISNVNILMKLSLSNRKRFLLQVPENFIKLYYSNIIPDTMFNCVFALAVHISLFSENKNCILCMSVSLQCSRTLSTPSRYVILSSLTDINKCSLYLGWYPVRVMHPADWILEQREFERTECFLLTKVVKKNTRATPKLTGPSW